ncbi:unnamed protein product [Ilex paraguariensis]|uniref:Uncharacterized protein n=1 Tax=Ilex paraguariensis TaxID=185542 RepID=A0ABC8S8S0_9AQUA
MANGVGKRRMGGLSAHEAHYMDNRAEAEGMRKKTFLPYKQGLLGCYSFSSKSHGAMNGFVKTLNLVFSRTQASGKMNEASDFVLEMSIQRLMSSEGGGMQARVIDVDARAQANASEVGGLIGIGEVGTQAGVESDAGPQPGVKDKTRNQEGAGSEVPWVGAEGEVLCTGEKVDCRVGMAESAPLGATRGLASAREASPGVAMEDGHGAGSQNGVPRGWVC